MNATSHVRESIFAVSYFKDLQLAYNKMFPDFNLTVHTTGTNSIQIETNRALLRNAIQNLTKNSMEAGAKKMVIVLEEKRICFIDDGPGISHEKANIIKEKGTTKTDSKGHGLGLLSLSRFCKNHGWKLSFHNNENTEYFPTGFTVEFILKN